MARQASASALSQALPQEIVKKEEDDEEERRPKYPAPDTSQMLPFKPRIVYRKSAIYLS